MGVVSLLEWNTVKISVEVLSPLLVTCNYRRYQYLYDQISSPTVCTLTTSVVDPDRNWIRIQDLCGSGSVFRYGSGTTQVDTVKDKLEAKGVRLKT